MSQNRGAADDRVPPTPTDGIEERIARSLHAHAAVHTPDPAVVAARLRSAGAGHRGVVIPMRRGGRVVAATVVTGTLAVAGAGAAAAANPYSGVARAVEDVAQAVGVDWSFMPEGYDRAQYEAFWGAGYGVADMEALSALWQTDAIETKARAGQMLLDGETPPVLPGSTPETAAPFEETRGVDAEAWTAFWDAGYTEADLEALVALWQADVGEVKTRAGRMVLDGETPPVLPGSTPERVDAPLEEGRKAAWKAFWQAGYTEADLQALVALWQGDVAEVKTRAGRMVLDGEPLPIAPGSAGSGREPGAAGG